MISASRGHKARILSLAFVLLVGLTTTGCSELAELSALLPEPKAAVTPAAGELVVDLNIVQGPNGSVLALVPVTIDGQGPFQFALDTGASQTVIDRQLVDELGLEVGGVTGPLTGVTGTTQAHTVQVNDWQLGDNDLPAVVAITMDLPDFYIPQGFRRPQTFRGLLGSDILSRFGAVTIDYSREVLILRDGR